jgi:hypothetical protein
MYAIGTSIWREMKGGGLQRLSLETETWYYSKSSLPSTQRARELIRLNKIRRGVIADTTDTDVEAVKAPLETRACVLDRAGELFAGKIEPVLRDLSADKSDGFLFDEDDRGQYSVVEHLLDHAGVSGWSSDPSLLAEELRQRITDWIENELRDRQNPCRPRVDKILSRLPDPLPSTALVRSYMGDVEAHAYKINVEALEALSQTTSWLRDVNPRLNVATDTLGSISGNSRLYVVPNRATVRSVVRDVATLALGDPYSVDAAVKKWDRDARRNRGLRSRMRRR